ncbi:MAG: alpha/beta hydrolase [Alphaproteobacteria bacterium]|nr:alpha/beta hydrolase [Alphaproteobacteria bacterium]
MAGGGAFEALGPATVRGAESFLLPSRHVGQAFHIDIATPPGKHDKSLPVITVLDGSFGFGMAAQMVGLLQSGRALPPAIVVGVGYPSAQDRKHVGAFRFREFCPTPAPQWLESVRGTVPPGELPADVKPGGAAAFLSFLNDELKPFVASQRNVDPTDQTLVGMSLGGLFALYTLFSKPESFQRYCALSPSIWWDDRTILSQEAEFAKTAKDLPVNLFLSIGALEEAEHGSARMVSNLYQLDAALRSRKYPSLRQAMEVFPNEGHITVFPASFTRGLRTVFGTAPGYESWAKLPG